MAEQSGRGKTKEMPFWEHVYELRRRIFIVLIFALVFTGAGYLFFPYFYRLIASTIGEELYATRITEGFLTRLKVSVLIGLFLSIPAFLFELVQFIFPALKPREKRFMLLLLVCTFLLFILGVWFAYGSVLPISINFLKSKEFFPENVSRLISYQTFITFFFQFLLGFGLCFQFPVVIVFLMRLGLIEVRTLVRFSKYFVIIAFLFSAILTPPDVISQIMLGVPMIALYGICILIGIIFKVGKR